MVTASCVSVLTNRVRDDEHLVHLAFEKEVPRKGRNGARLGNVGESP